MGAFGGLVMTNRGRNLQIKAQLGVTLQFSKIAIGDGSLSGQSILDLNNLVNQKMTLTINKEQANSDGTYTIGAPLSNQTVVTGFAFREIGLFAQDPDLGEILYSYANAGTNADYIPAIGGAEIIEKQLDIITIVGNATNVNANINQSLVFTTLQSFNTHKNGSVLDHPDGSVTTPKLAPKSVTAAKISDNTIGSGQLANGAATDIVIGNRTIDDTAAPSTGPNTITNLFSFIGKMIRQITGKSSWITAPATTLEAANTHINATTGIHGAVSTATANTIIQRDVAGRAQVAVPAAAADIARKDTVDAVDAKLKTTQLLTTNLNYGLQAVNADQAGPVDLGARGRTLVNFFERLSRGDSLNGGWLFAGGVLSVDPTVNSNGAASLKALIPTGISSSTVSVRRLTPTVDQTKHYLFLADIKNTNWASYYLYAYGSAISGSSYGSAKNGFKRHYLKLTPAQIAVTSHLSVYGSAAGDNYLNTSSWSLYEISAADYAKIDVDPEFTGDKLAAKYPYTEGIANVNGLYVTKSGKNLLPPFNEWMVPSNAVVTETYKYSLNATSVSQYCSVKVNVLRNTNYTLSCAHNGRMAVYNEAVNTVILGYSALQLITFNSGNNDVISIILGNDTVGVGTYTFTNPILNLGSTALPFEPKSDQSIYVPNQQFASSVDGSVYDSLSKMGNKYYKESRFKRMNLDGSLAWTFDSDPTGFKRVKIDLIGVSGNSDDSLRTMKYDGAMIKFDSGSLLSADLRFYNAGISKYFITIADTESGWGETYTPSTAEIQAYFNGWKMCDGVSQINKYNSGTKWWTYRLDGVNGANNAQYSTMQGTLPTMLAPNFSPYKLQYQLSVSTIEEIPVEGDIALHEGGNQIEVGSGIIVREKANPQLVAGTYKINDGNTPLTLLKYRSLDILSVNKGLLQAKGSRIYDSFFKLHRYEVTSVDYDPTADYYVTYITLDKYGITCNPTDVSIQYGANMATVVSNLAQDLADNTTKDSIQDWLLLQDGAYLDNLRIDVDTHRNASTAHGSTPNAAASTIMQRDPNGQANVGTPTANSHIARKQDVDNASNAANTAQTTANSALTRANASLPKDGLEQMTGPLSFSGIGRISSPTSFAEIDAKEACYFGSNCYYDAGAWKRHDTSKAACLMEVNYASTGMTRFYVTTAGANPITWSNSSPVWTGSNDGAGSGLDADVLRGFAPFYAATGDTIVTREPSGNINASSYNGYIPVNKGGDQMTGIFRSALASGRISDVSGVPAIEVNSSAAAAAYMAFHRNGAFAAYFGMDTDNYLKFGGWSLGNVAFKVWTEQLLRSNGNGALEWNDSGTWKAVGGVKKVQRGVSSGGDITVTAVNMDKSFLTFTNNSKPQNGDMFASAYLLNSTTVRITATNPTGSYSWELVEFY
ncbi:MULTISPECIES: phage tail-collar fiber domain-containing protein [unclassified Paenibacillus]|uniref:phage tail-collar fiber domain-containing protein n=1 Tax=unclassified Paenibacillus TaxID=185978 RepID=UPI003638EA28